MNLPPTDDPGLPADWSEFRQQMPIVRQWTYLDHAAVSPLPRPTREAIVAWAEEATVAGNTAWTDWSRRAEQVRLAAARLIGAEPEEIALVKNTTQGINLVAEGFPWRSGDNVVLPADEFPTNQYPWLRLAERGVETRRIPVSEGRVDLDGLAAACDRHTRILSASWVGYASGWRADVDRLVKIAHGCGALLCLDAIQALGVFPLDVRRTGVDFLAADGHKWLLGPEGAGVFFLRREHIDRLRPLGLGWHSVKHSHDYQRIELDLRDTAARYEGGSENLLGYIALGASLDLLARFGSEALSRRVLELTDYACGRLQEIGAVLYSDRQGDHRSGIVRFDLPGRDLAAVRRDCLARHVVLSLRSGGLRISPHAYNNPEDIDRLIEAIGRA
jgi:selenocysteine lyase/cysteine desulfurase